MAVGIMRDPRVIALAEAVGVSVPTATGHVVGVLTALPEGAITGDLSEISDRTLEQWALWAGKRGRFAAAFRAQLCDEQGVVRAWAKHNGSKLEEMAADRERKREARRLAKAAKLSAGPSGDCPPDTDRTSGGNPPLRDETRRDETNNTELQASLLPEDSLASPRKRVAPKRTAEPKHPHFVEPYRGQVIEAWQRLGAVNIGRLVNAIGPCFRPAGDPAHVPPAFVVMGVVDYCALVTKGKGAPFASPEDCAKRLLTLGRNCERLDATDPVARIDANFLAIHGHRMAGAGAV